MQSDSSVKRANRLFFDIIADIYEEVDFRRSEKITGWLDAVIHNLQVETNGISLLDIGSGTGLLMKYAKKYFKNVYGIDLSTKMLKKTPGYNVLCSDCSFLPFKDETFDVVTVFAVLHHLYDYYSLFAEAYRVLRKGGILYTDHDLDIKFSSTFYLPMKVYNAFFGMRKRYLNKGLSPELHDSAEVGLKGIEADKLKFQLMKVGFSEIHTRYHWQGVNLLTTYFLKSQSFPRGVAPLIRIYAHK